MPHGVREEYEEDYLLGIFCCSFVPVDQEDSMMRPMLVIAVILSVGECI